MSLKFMKKTILIFCLFCLNFVKNSLERFDNDKSLRFLFDKKSEGKHAYAKNKIIADEYNLIDRVRELNPLELFYGAAAKEENKSFNVRCFWVDLETLRVYDLIKLKTKKYLGFLIIC